MAHPIVLDATIDPRRLHSNGTQALQRANFYCVILQMGRQSPRGN
jgi:hypothetical protein